MMLPEGFFSDPETDYMGSIDGLFYSGLPLILPAGGANWLDRQRGRYIGLINLSFNPFNSRNY